MSQKFNECSVNWIFFRTTDGENIRYLFAVSERIVQTIWLSSSESSKSFDSPKTNRTSRVENLMDALSPAQAVLLKASTERSAHWRPQACSETQRCGTQVKWAESGAHSLWRTVAHERLCRTHSSRARVRSRCPVHVSTLEQFQTSLNKVHIRVLELFFNR